MNIQSTMIECKNQQLGKSCVQFSSPVIGYIAQSHTPVVSDTQANPLSPQITPQEFLIRQPKLGLQPTRVTPWLGASLAPLQVPFTQNWNPEVEMETARDWVLSLFTSYRQSLKGIKEESLILNLELMQSEFVVMAVLQGVTVAKVVAFRSQGYITARPTPLTLAQLKDEAKQPPLHPKAPFPAGVQESTSWMDMALRLLLYMREVMTMLSRGAMIQQDPQAPWLMTGVDLQAQFRVTFSGTVQRVWSLRVRVPLGSRMVLELMMF